MEQLHSKKGGGHIFKGEPIFRDDGTTLLQSSKRAPMGGVPYKSDKEGGECSSKRFLHLTTKKHPSWPHVMFTMSSKQIIGQTNNRITTGFEIVLTTHNTLMASCHREHV